MWNLYNNVNGLQMPPPQEPYSAQAASRFVHAGLACRAAPILINSVSTTPANLLEFEIVTGNTGIQSTLLENFIISNAIFARQAIFTARCYASAVLAMGLCLSVTSPCSTKTANTGSHKQNHTIPQL